MVVPLLILYYFSFCRSSNDSLLDLREKKRVVEAKRRILNKRTVGRMLMQPMARTGTSRVSGGKGEAYLVCFVFVAEGFLITLGKQEESVVAD